MPEPNMVIWYVVGLVAFSAAFVLLVWHFGRTVKRQYDLVAQAAAINSRSETIQERFANLLDRQEAVLSRVEEVVRRVEERGT